MILFVPAHTGSFLNGESGNLSACSWQAASIAVFNSIIVSSGQPTAITDISIPDVVRGNAKAIEKMAKYNYQDVALLEKVFFAMLPHCHSTVLNHNLFSDSPDYVCPGCGSCRVQRRGRLINKTATKTRFQCQDCGQWSSIKER